jgi:23S rRNA (cytosine1962-C5)-methyltransferase
MDPARLRRDAAPSLELATGWEDYALLDSGAGRKLERYGVVQVVRPEPQCWWRPRLPEEAWAAADAAFDPHGEEDEGRWRLKGGALPDWDLRFGPVRFKARLTPFRHLGFFPEQQPNWLFLEARVRALGRPFRLLNLFGYSGVATLVAAAAGALVTHVDASKKAIAYARENAQISGLAERPIRWICEDARRYVQREVRRGVLYDGVVLDPPKYGRGPGGEVWRLNEDLAPLVAACADLLAPDADLLLLNAYAERLSGLSLASLLAESLARREGRLAFGELGLREVEGPSPARAVGLSFFARWSRT